MAQLIAHERGRRSSRVLVSLALAVSGQKSDGSHVSGAAETILVNRHGAKIRSTVPLEPKMEVRVAMLAPYKWRVGQVVWADTGEREYGIELYRPENFWGIYFPPEDWELGVPAVTVVSNAPASGATQPRVAMQAEPSSAPQGPAAAASAGRRDHRHPERHCQQWPSVSGTRPDSSRGRTRCHHADRTAGQPGLKVAGDLQQELRGRCAGHGNVTQPRV